jgi:hypothetical protein
MGELTPAQASTLSLLLRHEQSYDDVARRLGINPMSVRARAHAAAVVLAGLEPGDGADGPLIDQALGQLPTRDAAALAAQLDDPDEAEKLERLTESLAAFVTPRVRSQDTRPATEAPVPVRVLELSPAAGTAIVRQPSRRVAGPAIVRRPRSRPSRRRAVSARMGAMLSLGLGSLAAGGVLFINGAH